jgi:ABC-2 type transport system ATP-binding protein
MHRPELLIMDEPTSGLDPLMQTEFHEVLKKANKDGTTLFFSSHILGDVQKICNRVSIIRNGVIEANEDIDSLLARQLKKVSLVLNDDAKEEQFAKEEISKLNLLHQRVSFTYSESPNELLRFIAQLEVKDLTIEEPTLEDIFMHYYE